MRLGEIPAWFERDKTEAEIAALRLGITESVAWARGAITVSGHYDWLAALPFDVRCALPDGTRVLCVHATHRRDDEYILSPNRTDDDLRAGWALLDAHPDRHEITSYRVDYDHEAVAAHARRVHYPAADFVARMQRVS